MNRINILGPAEHIVSFGCDNPEDLEIIESFWNNNKGSLPKKSQLRFLQIIKEEGRYYLIIALYQYVRQRLCLGNTGCDSNFRLLHLKKQIKLETNDHELVISSLFMANHLLCKTKSKELYIVEIPNCVIHNEHICIRVIKIVLPYNPKIHSVCFSKKDRILIIGTEHGTYYSGHNQEGRISTMLEKIDDLEILEIIHNDEFSEYYFLTSDRELYHGYNPTELKLLLESVIGLFVHDGKVCCLTNENLGYICRNGSLSKSDLLEGSIFRRLISIRSD